MYIQMYDMLIDMYILYIYIHTYMCVYIYIHCICVCVCIPSMINLVRIAPPGTRFVKLFFALVCYEYPLAIKHGSGKSPINKWSQWDMFQPCFLWPCLIVVR